VALGILIGLEYGPAATLTTVTLVMVVTIARKLERAYFARRNVVQLEEKRPQKKEAA
jgi:hypothetical protein